MTDQDNKMTTRQKIQAAIMIMVVAGLVFSGAQSLDSSQSNTDVLAEVGDTTITTAQFDEIFKNNLSNMQRNLPAGTNLSTYDTVENRQALLNQLVNDTMIGQWIKSNKSPIGDKAIVQAMMDPEINTIVKIKRDENGQVDAKDLEDQLQKLQISQAQFREYLAQNYLKKSIEDLITTSQTQTPLKAQTFAKNFGNTRTVEIKDLDISNEMAAVELSEEQIKSEYQANPTRYLADESYGIEYVIINAPEASSDISNDELKTLIGGNPSDDDIAKLKADPNKLKLVLQANGGNKLKELAKKVQADITAHPKDLDYIAKAYHSKIEAKNDVQTSNLQNLPSELQQPDVKAQLLSPMAAKDKTIVGPAKINDNQILVGRVTQYQPAEQLTLEKARLKIEDQLRRQMAIVQAKNKLENTSASTSIGTPLVSSWTSQIAGLKPETTFQIMNLDAASLPKHLVETNNEFVKLIRVVKEQPNTIPAQAMSEFSTQWQQWSDFINQQAFLSSLSKTLNVKVNYDKLVPQNLNLTKPKAY